MLTTPDPDILLALSTIIDPELGLNIVDLGLVYRAHFTAEGIVVRFTMTSPACPVSETMLRDVRAALREKFPDACAIDVALTWDPPWSPSRMSDAARWRLGWRPTPRSSVASWPKRFFDRLTRH